MIGTQGAKNHSCLWTISLAHNNAAEAKLIDLNKSISSVIIKEVKPAVMWTAFCIVGAI